MPAMDFDFVQDSPGLKGLCARIAESDWIAVDTEFLRERTYYPQLCLIQVATPEWACCVDPLAGIDLGPLLDVFYRTDLTKVLHAATQDLEIFCFLRGEVPKPVFDTQLAAPVLGYADQIGYGNLVREVLGTRLDKAHTRADWSRRPLTDEQLQYAADDVIYLAQLYPKLRGELERKKRLDWLDRDLEELVRADRYSVDPEQAWIRIKGVDRLKGGNLAVAQSLARWREITAQREDRPRGWLLKDDALVDIARMRPRRLGALRQVRGIHDRLTDRYGDELIELVRRAAEERPQPWPGTRRVLRPSPIQEALVDVLMGVVRARAAECSLNPAVLAPRKELLRLVMGDESSAVLQGWRGEIVGATLQSVLSGELSLHVEDGSVKLFRRP